jgi:hypothetical protein
MSKIIGRLLWFLSKHHLWKRPTGSMGIGGEPTYGYGKLSDNGYWQFPVYPQKRESPDDCPRKQGVKEEKDEQA